MAKGKSLEYVFVCTGKDCKRNGAKDLIKEIKTEYPKMRVIKTKCSDHCKKGPVVFYKDHKFLKATLKNLDEKIGENKKGA